MKEFVLDYVSQASKDWKARPTIVTEGVQDALILIFGDPRTAIFAHMDSIGYTVRYQDQLVPIGSPEAETGWSLVGEDSLGPVQCTLRVDDVGQLFYDFPRGLDRGTSLVFEPNTVIDDLFVTSPYLDNRLGVYSALRVAETLENGAIVFSTYEEHGGGAVPFLLKYLYEQHEIGQALISDITWVTEGVSHGKGVAISLRDQNIPRRKFLDRVLALASQSEVPFQLEVESGGSSDGREVQQSPYPIDWCFVGAPESNVHSPKECVHLDDIASMIKMYRYLMAHL